MRGFSKSPMRESAKEIGHCVWNLPSWRIFGTGPGSVATCCFVCFVQIQFRILQFEPFVEAFGGSLVLCDK